jgi:SnoaL-like protein
MPQPLTEAEVKTFVHEWYRALDWHAKEDEAAAMVADEGLEMRFPEGTLTTVDQFRDWYRTVTNRFFDEIHTMKMLHIDVTQDPVEVKLVVEWQAKIWDPPAHASTWIGFDAYQTWYVRRSESTGKPVIATYIVDELRALPGSASLA